MIYRLAVLAVLSLFILPTAHADEATKRAKIQEMFVVLKMDTMMKQMMSQGVKQGEQAGLAMFGNHPLSDADKKLLSDFETRLVDLMSDELGWEKLQASYTDLYASAYTEEELDGILAFYKSPIGQSVLNKTPALLVAAGKVVAARTQELSPRLQQLTANFEKEYRAAHPTPDASK